MCNRKLKETSSVYRNITDKISEKNKEKIPFAIATTIKNINKFNKGSKEPLYLKLQDVVERN